MKKFIVISFCLLLVVGCGKPKKDIIQPEVYTKAEVDSLVNDLRNETKQSVDLLVEKQKENNSLIVKNSLEFNNYRKNITAIQIPDEVYFCNQLIPLDRPDVR